MSLGKLLATGRSLIGGAPGEGRYNISNANRLPKFGAVKNPFAPSATSEARAAGSGTGVSPVRCEEQTRADIGMQTEPMESRDGSADRLEVCPTTQSDCERVEARIAEFVKHSETACVETPKAQVQAEQPFTPAISPSEEEWEGSPAESAAGSGAGVSSAQLEEQSLVAPQARAEISDSADRSLDRRDACPTTKAALASWLGKIWRSSRTLAVAVFTWVRGIRWRAALLFCRSMARIGWEKLKFISIKLAGLFRRREQSEPKPVFPRFGKSVVQAELSLDTVKVVRSSLEDSDLEIVTFDTRTATQVAPTTPVAQPSRGPVPAALKKMTGVILKH